MPVDSRSEPTTAAVEASPAIRVAGVSKLYRKGVTTGWYRYRSLREDVARTVSGLWRRDGDGEDEQSFFALRDVSFEIAVGERVGIIGRNGAGKTTLLRILAQITPLSAGRVELRGRVGALLEVGTGFHPELTGRDNIFLSAAILGKPRSEIKAHLDDIVDFADIGDFLDTPVKRYSTGMYLRLAFAVAAHLEPDILLVDEVLAVGDAEFQRKCLARMAEIAEGGRTVVFVSHNVPSVLRLCDRVLLLDGGRLAADGPAADVVGAYLQSGLVSTAERRWHTVDDAPGDHVARLKSVRVLQGGVVTRQVDLRHQVDVEVEYWHLGPPAVTTFVTLRFMSANGTCLFATSDASARAGHGPSAGPGGPRLQRSTCEVPGKLLAEAEVLVDALLWSGDGPMPHAEQREAVSFVAVDCASSDGLAGPDGGRWPGVVRPHLAWRIDAAEG